MGQFPHGDCAGKVRTIERFHAVTRGWSGIAYSAVVCPHGYVFEGRGTGVRSAANGTSAIGGNDHWYAVCYLSGQMDPFTDAAKAGVIDAVRWLRAKGGAGPAVNGHRDHHPTECPGSTIYRWLQTAAFDAAPEQQEDPDMEPKQIAGAPITFTNPGGAKVQSTVQGAFDDLRDRTLAQGKALQEIRDVQLPAVLAKLDELLGKAPGA